MSEANAETVEMVEWTTPDDVTIQVPKDQLKGLEGINERFNNLTKTEQEYSKKEKALSKQIEDAQEAARDAAWDELDEEAYKLLGTSKGFTGEEEPPPADEPGDGPDPMDEIKKIRAELAERDAATKTAQEQADYEAAEQQVADEMAVAAEANDGFKGLFIDHFKNQAYAKAWEVLEESNYNTSTEDAVQAGIEFATELQNSAIEAHKASKKAGPGAPGTAAGEMERPQDFADDKARDDHVKAFAARLQAAGG